MNDDIDVKVIYGVRLAELRQAANLSTETVAERLRIAKSIITDIETEKTHRIPIVFLRGYIKSYANLVNLPKAELFDYLEQVESNNKNQMRIKHYSQIGKQKHYGWRLTILLFCIFLIITSITGFCFWGEYYGF